jgi:hypothetical protein
VAELLLVGVTHYPPLSWRDEDMAGILRNIRKDPGIPGDAKDPANWPEPMRLEWGDDEARSSAATHRAQLLAGFEQARNALESFDPDFLLVWGDDQYENFREDLIPPYALLAYDDLEAQPWKSARLPNVWGEADTTSFKVQGRPDAARWLARRLLEDGIDLAYAYRPLHHPSLAHAFLNTVLFLDYHRVGFPWPMICMPINCYGSKVISARGMFLPFGQEAEPDPPAPGPRRVMEVGSAVARHLADSPWRVALVASSSWSHAFLTDHTWRLRPDTPADRRLYEALATGDFATWENTPLSAVEHAGQQEVLNWFALMGAARELGRRTPDWSTFVETWCFNSNKVFACWS